MEYHWIRINSLLVYQVADIQAVFRHLQSSGPSVYLPHIIRTLEILVGRNNLVTFFE